MCLSSLVACAFLGTLLAITWTTAIGSGPTNEEEALADFNAGHHPVTLSADGQWLIYVDAHNVLHRRRVQGASAIESIELVEPIEALDGTRTRFPIGSVKALSVSQSGEKVAFVTSDNCVGIAAFHDGSQGSSKTRTNRNAPQITWFDRVSNDTGSETGRCPIQAPSEESSGRSYGAFAVALSSKGNLVAISGNPIRVIDVASRRIVHKVPTGEVSVLHLRFVDAERKLFVVQALMGEQWESAATGSDMQFAVWDLQKKELFNFHNTKTTGNLISFDYLWSFSDATGELWAINTNGNYWDTEAANSGKSIRDVIRPYTTNLKRCTADKAPGPVLPPSDDDGWLGFIADPLGRWVAGVTSSFNGKLKRAESILWVRDSRTGKALEEWRIDSELRSLTTSPDGKTLFGVTAGQPRPEDFSYTRIAWFFSGGGELKTFDLSSHIAGLAPVAVRTWPDQRCMIEGEEPLARDIIVDTKKRPSLYEVQLIPPPGMYPCDGGSIELGGHAGPGKTTAWRQLSDGTLWFDRWSSLERINAENGQVLQRIPTPRTGSACSIPLYEERQFLSWQGDTITLRPFSETLTTSIRKILVQKPGWYATQVVLMGNRFGVRWINSKYMNNAKSENGIDGSAAAIVYDVSGRQLSQTLGQVLNGSALFPGEGDEGGSNVFDEYMRTSEQQGSYRWARSYAGSLRAYRRDGDANTERTALWSGVRFDKNAAASGEAASDIDRPDSWVVNLGASLGALINRESIRVYDADKRTRLALIKVQNPRFNSVVEVAWNPVNRVLLVETVQLDAERPTLDKLIAYRIE